jgi:hypothetical protein
MAQRGPLHFKLLSLLVIATVTFSCNKAIKEESKLPSSFVVNRYDSRDTILLRIKPKMIMAYII